MQIVIVTGLSGAGKSTALRALEDIEFTCVDNIPVPLVNQLVDHLAHEGDRDKLAIAIDSRQRRNLNGWQAALGTLRGAGHRLEVMFLDASDEVLLRRFSETRRRHPLSGDDLTDGVRRDREVMAELRHGAAVVDTSNLNMHQLKAIIQDRYGGTGKLAVTLVSFGFKNGLPLEFNMVFDVRFLQNPYYEPNLTHLDGRDPCRRSGSRDRNRAHDGRGGGIGFRARRRPGNDRGESESKAKGESEAVRSTAAVRGSNLLPR